MRAITSNGAEPALHEQARRLRDDVFGRRVFGRGVWTVPAVSAMEVLSDGGYIRAFQAGANLATVNLTPRAVRRGYPVNKRDRTIMDEERVLAAIAAAGCAPSGIGLTEHLRKIKPLATGRVSHSSETASRAFEAVHSDTCP